MARIRTLKPECWEDERVGFVSRDARLLWVVLITMADDEGRFRAVPAMIAGHGFGYDDDALAGIPGWLQELQDVGLVLLYGGPGDSRSAPEFPGPSRGPFGCLPKWPRHQRVNKPSPSRIPAAPELSGGAPDSAGEPGPHAGAPEQEQDQDQGARTMEQGAEEQGAAAGGSDPERVDLPAAAAPPAAALLSLPESIENACDTLAAAGLHVHDRTTVSRLAAQHPDVDIVEAAIRCAHWGRGRRIKHPLAALRTIVEGDDAPRLPKAADARFARFDESTIVDRDYARGA